MNNNLGEKMLEAGVKLLSRELERKAEKDGKEKDDSSSKVTCKRVSNRVLQSRNSDLKFRAIP